MNKTFLTNEICESGGISHVFTIRGLRAFWRRLLFALAHRTIASPPDNFGVLNNKEKLKTGEDQNAQTPQTQQPRVRLWISHFDCHGDHQFRSDGTFLEEPRGSDVNHLVQPRIGEAGEVSEGERLAQEVDGNGNREGREKDVIIGGEGGGLEHKFERREDEGGRVWRRNQGSDEDKDNNDRIDEGQRGAEGNPGRDRQHDGEERMEFQEDGAEEIAPILEMEADEKVGF
jgi:hypothetical protein